MTQNSETILKGLHCCSRTNPFCEECPYVETEVHCRELESDAAQLIISLSAELNEKDSLINTLNNDINVKLCYIRELESVIVDINRLFSEGDFAEGQKLVISFAEKLRTTHE